MPVIDELTVHAMTPSRWDDVVDVVGTRGDPAYCWCQYFVTGRSDSRPTASQNRAAMRSRMESGDRPPGLLAYAGGEPVGWVQLGPLTAYARLCESRSLAKVRGPVDRDGDDVWAVTCFVVRVGHRRHGVATRLLESAVDFARDQGARVLEGHPVDVTARPSGRAGGAELYQGVASTFVAGGFEEVGRTSPTRPVVRLEL